jgi:hypothetical protein
MPVPADTKPADNKPADTKPADNKPADTKPAEKKTTDKPMKDDLGATVETLVVVQPIEEEEDDTCYIVYYENFTDDNGVQHRRAHRVPRDNWDKYAKKHGF